jgi:hypothetical protein
LDSLLSFWFAAGHGAQLYRLTPFHGSDYAICNSLLYS